MTRYTHTMCMAFGADGEPDRVEVDATFDYLVAGSAVSDIRVLKIDGRAVAVADADLHDRIHDGLESGRFDDLLISLVTPSPQSVAAPMTEPSPPAKTYRMTTYPTLRSANVARQDEWDQDGQISASYRGNELAGEVGEACNVIKKLERERLGILGSRATVDELADELADVVICADLIAMYYGIDLEDAVARKFNATSEKVGLRTRLAVPTEGGEK